MYTVKTFDNSGLCDCAVNLNKTVFKDFIPDVVIGIRSGGFVIAEIMAKEAAHKPKLLAISRQRASTQTKNKIKGLKNILRVLPYAITDKLRIIEHKRLNATPATEVKEFSPNIDELAALCKTLKTLENGKILIVDDAVDSGATMKAVLEVVKAEACSSCTIKTAAVTVTTNQPLINPDYYLYHHVLCRFPWSFDFKG